jgi:predicted PurR-regulated permease PerM
MHVAYRAVLLAAGLVVVGLAFRHLVTLLLAVVMTVIISIPLSAAASRLERRGVPRPLGALLGLLAGAAAAAGALALIIPPFVDQVNALVDGMPAIVESLRGRIVETTGASSYEVGERVQAFLRDYTEDPLRLIGPVASVGASVAGVLAALIVMTMTAYYIAVRPEPLIEGVVRMFPPNRRQRAVEVLERVRESWIGWMRGVAIDMAISGVLLYVGLRLVGLDYAVVFAVLTALLVVVPYYGAIVGAIPPILLALTDSPGKALLVLAVYVVVQQIEGNVIVPVVMSRTMRLHPAVIAVGVVMVGALFGVVGLFVAVPLIATSVILVEELWVRRVEEPNARDGPALVGASARGEPPPAREATLG